VSCHCEKISNIIPVDRHCVPANSDADAVSGAPSTGPIVQAV
jgi:hypothetical protein